MTRTEDTRQDSGMGRALGKGLSSSQEDVGTAAARAPEGASGQAPGPQHGGDRSGKRGG